MKETEEKIEYDIIGIGNPLIDILIKSQEQDLMKFNIAKGRMHLIDEEKREEILNFYKDIRPEYKCGGDVPNTLIALSKLGLKTAFSGTIGNDTYGEIYNNTLINHKVSSYMNKAKGLTGSSIILITPDSERTMNTFLGSAGLYTKEDVNEKVIKTSKFVYFSGYAFSTETQKKALIHALEIARDNNRIVCFDVADVFVINQNRKDLMRIIQDFVDIIFVNYDEGLALFNTPDLNFVLDELSKSVDIAVVKHGANGAFIKPNGSATIMIPANKVQAVDSTGAGDMFAAGFIYGVAHHYGLEKSGKFAAYLASNIVKYVGAQFEEQVFEELINEIKIKF
jgi:sugar/nucleoside kinase (ribokinase family)